MRQTVRVASLKNMARLCECGRVASYRITLWQLSGEGRGRGVNLILCGVCFRDWMRIEGDELAQAGRLDTTSIDGGGGACYGTYRGDMVDSTDKTRSDESTAPLPDRVNKLLVELAAVRCEVDRALVHLQRCRAMLDRIEASMNGTEG